MLDTFSKKNDLQLVIDQSNFGVLTQATSFAVANAVAAGIPNSSVMNVMLNKSSAFKNAEYRTSTDINFTLLKQSPIALVPCEANVAKAVPMTSNAGLFDIEEMLDITPAWLEKRKLANIRANGLAGLEQRIERYMGRIKTFAGDEIFIPFMAAELNKLESPAIIEWATIQGLTLSEARTDLEIKVKTSQYFVSCLNAIWEKYVRKINALTTASEITHCVWFEAELELRSGNQ